MRFPVAWANIISQNLSLRVAIIGLSITTTGLIFLSAKAMFREPLIIDRGCLSNVVETAPSERSAHEISAFLKEALSQRFDTKAQEQVLISRPEQLARRKEQKSFAQNKISQTIVVSHVDTSSKPILVKSDRLISVGEIRSAFKFNLNAEVATTTRTKSNPYGLVLTKVVVLKEENSSEK